MQDLDRALTQYQTLDQYPFHMPGHKRSELAFSNPYSMDITEIEGFDNLHHATGILKEAQQRAADLYHSRHCFYLVNGSTCGLLAAICAAARKRDRVLVARNCHKAVYHALYVNELQAQYLYPAITGNEIQGQITKKQVSEALSHDPDIAAVIITSPTYEGVISDVSGIAEAAHAHGIPLIVDEAHGAHLGFGADFPENAVKQGADAVIMSLHKTLPSFTQTALLHLCSDRIAEKQVEKYLDIFETSSPSYLLMAGMESCVRMLRENKQQLFTSCREKLNRFYKDTAELTKLHVMNRRDFLEEEVFDWDDSKLVIFTEKAGVTGKELYRLLLDDYHLQMEMVSGSYVLGMTSIMDRQEGFDRLAYALYEIDRKLTNGTVTAAHKNGKIETGSDFIRCMYQKNRMEMQIYQASELPDREVPLDEAVGKMSAGYLFLYPPGIPMIVPGEIISREFIEKIRVCRRKGLNIEGSVDFSLGRIKIVYF